MPILVHQELTWAWKKKKRLSYLGVIINIAEGPKLQTNPEHEEKEGMEERGREGREEREGRNNTKADESLHRMQQERLSMSVQSKAEKAGAGGQDGGELLGTKQGWWSHRHVFNHVYWLQQKGEGSNKKPPKKQARSLLPTDLILAKQLSKYADKFL